MMQSAPSDNTPSLAASTLDDPLYYLKNLRAVICWVLQHHSELLLAQELERLRCLLELAEPGQALLARMIMRKGEYFRGDGLAYQEIPDTRAALADLVAAGFVESSPPLSSADLFRLLRLPELKALLASYEIALPRGARKSDLFEPLRGLELRCGVRPMSDWWPGSGIDVLALTCQPLMDRVRVMFFGNGYQDWSEFVLTELGIQRYETVQFPPASRAFAQRDQVDVYIALMQCQQILEETGDCVAALEQLPPPSANAWLANRREKVLFQLGQQAERQGETALALSLYRDNCREDAIVRRFRVLEKEVQPQEVLAQIESVLPALKQPLTHLHLQRVRHRAARKLGQTVARPARPSVITESLNLRRDADRGVEAQVVEHFNASRNLQAYHTENALFTGLLGLLCWPVLFEPLPGAFFHPFQDGPADLYRPDFVERRQQQFSERLASLENGNYRSLIKDCWRNKQGLASSLVNWQQLNESLLDQALSMIPARHLRAIFEHLLADLRHHRSGMPDLVVFDTERRHYRLVEVKGPGDRLQDHQLLWLEVLSDIGADVSVLHVDWEAA